MRKTLLCAVLLGCGSPGGAAIELELGVDAGFCVGDCEQMEGAGGGSSEEKPDATTEDRPTVRLLGFSDYEDKPDRDGAAPMEVDAGPLVQPDSGVPTEVDAGPQLARLCEPCEAQADCAEGLNCTDFEALGHTASAGQGAYCLPTCTSYLNKEGNTECTAVFSDHLCMASVGTCRPRGYDGADGVADQCNAWWGL